MIEITQADRDAAARAWAEDNDEPLDCHICEQIRAGYGDNSLDVIRFARHRMEATEALWDIVEDVLADAYDIGKIEAEHHGYLHKRIRAALGDTK